MKYRSVTISELSDILGICPVYGTRNTNFEDLDHLVIHGLNLCNHTTVFNSILSYVTNDKFLDTIKNNPSVTALILSQQVYHNIAGYLNPDMVYFISDTPERVFYDLHNSLWYDYDFYDHYTTDPIIGVDCNIHKSAVIENGVIIKDRVTVGPNSVIRSGTIIESDSYIGCCSVIGSEGFQAIRGYHKSIKHVGGTHIGANVWIGDNTTIGNEAFEGYSEVGENTKINNHVHIAHCCKIGKNCVITASVLMMGSTKLGDNVWLAPNSVLMNKVLVEQDAFVGTMSLVTKDVPEGITVVGIPAKSWVKK
ncbi:DapH/DapD/GlmU-related protein [uncultured Bacteroides sp.]|mgnify:CR=1 FL=1|uniref:DapH/DapD/GlmU-related protein n=1 Tax=uncultured Bacteroides sp. TaxID=162156 RepID=UPI0025F91633|nr:DapH/DapD/GlmU-related protein [uncultured Bacteroides sp.]